MLDFVSSVTAVFELSYIVIGWLVLASTKVKAATFFFSLSKKSRLLDVYGSKLSYEAVMFLHLVVGMS
jgi:hypothetical protein